jgi:hypothetical protein
MGLEAFIFQGADLSSRATCQREIPNLVVASRRDVQSFILLNMRERSVSPVKGDIFGQNSTLSIGARLEGLPPPRYQKLSKLGKNGGPRRL